MKLNMIIFPPNDWLLLFFWSSKNEIQKYNNNIPDINYLWFFTFVFFFFFIINLPLFFYWLWILKIKRTLFEDHVHIFLLSFLIRRLTEWNPANSFKKFVGTKIKYLMADILEEKDEEEEEGEKKIVVYLVCLSGSMI